MEKRKERYRQLANRLLFGYTEREFRFYFSETDRQEIMKKMKKAVAVFMAVCMTACVISGCGGDGVSQTEKKLPERTVKINFPTAGASGALYAVGAAVTHMWTTYVPGVQAKSQASEGGVANLHMVADGEAQVSVAISSNVEECVNGTGSFKDHPYKDLKVIAGLYMNPNQVVVTERSGIKKLSDAKGKRFAVASAGSSVYNECDVHFTTAGLHFPEDIQAEYIAFTDAADLLRNGSVDGAWVMSGAPASAVTQALAEGCRLVDMNEDLIGRLKEKYPRYAAYTIPAGTYPGQKKDIRTSAVKMVMFTRGDLPEELVYRLTKAFWEHIGELGEVQKNLKELTPAEAVKDIGDLPFHSGAVKYYKEIGVWKS